MTPPRCASSALRLAPPLPHEVDLFRAHNPEWANTIRRDVDIDIDIRVDVDVDATLAIVPST
jgi:hypothetical protein